MIQICGLKYICKTFNYVEYVPDHFVFFNFKKQLNIVTETEFYLSLSMVSVKCDNFSWQKRFVTLYSHNV